jgi:hypothetical protein
MSTHTPGPWNADWDDNGQWYVAIGGLSVSGNALRGDSGECVESANARLIAAAPELLEAARLQVLNFERSDVSGNFLGDDDHEAWTALNKAIAKAEGR